MTLEQIQQDIIGLEQIEQTLYRLLEHQEDPEVQEELRKLRITILHLNQAKILEKRKEERRQEGDRRVSIGDRRQKTPRRSVVSRRSRTLM